MEKDAVSFKPLGEKIYSYNRKGALGKGKGKEAPSGDLNEEDENVIVYEVYHVRLHQMLQPTAPIFSRFD